MPRRVCWKRGEPARKGSGTDRMQGRAQRWANNGAGGLQATRMVAPIYRASVVPGGMSYNNWLLAPLAWQIHHHAFGIYIYVPSLQREASRHWQGPPPTIGFAMTGAEDAAPSLYAVLECSILVRGALGTLASGRHGVAVTQPVAPVARCTPPPW